MTDSARRSPAGRDGAPPEGAPPAARRASAAAEAREAEKRGDAQANEAWRRYRLIRDGQRDPDELLAEGIALSAMAIALARQA